jgi:hypothetical protein
VLHGVSDAQTWTPAAARGLAVDRASEAAALVVAVLVAAFAFGLLGDGFIGITGDRGILVDVLVTHVVPPSWELCGFRSLRERNRPARIEPRY